MSATVTFLEGRERLALLSEVLRELEMSGDFRDAQRAYDQGSKVFATMLIKVAALGVVSRLQMDKSLALGDAARLSELLGEPEGEVFAHYQAAQRALKADCDFVIEAAVSEFFSRQKLQQIAAE